jgi:phage tail P2-like protein
MSDRDDFMNSTLLPPALAIDLSMRALETLIARLARIDIGPTLIYDFEHVAESALPHMGEQFHVLGAEGWNLATTEAQRRALLARAIALHRRKGTPWSIREALKAIGFNDLLIEEGLPSNRYDGSISYSGAEAHAAYGWAQFRVVADVGDEQPITAARLSLVVETINAWKPARSHLVDVRYRASDTESVKTTEKASLAGVMMYDDPHRWGRYFYDGALNYDQGALHHWDGLPRYDGAARYDGYSPTPTGARYDGERERERLSAQIVLSDRQILCPAHDAVIDYGGAADYGASAPVAEDKPMPIQCRRHRRYDGRLAYSAQRYNGASRYVGQIIHHGNTPYSGDVVTTLEA